MNWQPIETAPKDGTEIAVIGNNFGNRSKGIHICLARFECGHFYNSENIDDDLAMECFLEHLTHWMPLPEEPK